MSLRKSHGLALVVGLLALAFAAVPAIASAAPQLTDEKGPVAVGTTITARSSNAVTQLTEVGELKCDEVEVHGIVEVNSGSLVKVAMDVPEVEGEPEDKAEGCTLNEEVPVEVEPTLNSIELTPTVKQAQFEFSALGAVETSTSTVTYMSPATEVHVEGSVTGEFPGSFSGDFTVEDVNGQITVH